MQKQHQVENLKDGKVLDMQVKPVQPQSRFVICVLARLSIPFRVLSVLIIVRMSVGEAKLGTNHSATGQALTQTPRKLEPVAGVASSFSGTVHGGCSRKPVSGYALCAVMTYCAGGCGA